MPQLSEATVGMLLLLGQGAAADPVLLSRLARLLTHSMLRATVLLGAPGTISEGNSCMHRVRAQHSLLSFLEAPCISHLA